MTFTYPAIFKQMPDGTYEGHFIDLEGCSARGDKLDLCIRDAIEEMRSWIQVELEEGIIEMPIFVKTTHWNGMLVDTYETTAPDA